MANLNNTMYEVIYNHFSYMLMQTYKVNKGIQMSTKLDYKVNSIIRDEIRRERSTLNQQVIEFLKNKGGCGEFMCMTCGGLWGFRSRFLEFLEGLGVSAITALCAVVPEDLVKKVNWQKFVEFIIDGMPVEQKETLFRTWRRSWGEIKEFDRFLLAKLLPENYFSTEEGKIWTLSMLLLPLDGPKMDLLYKSRQSGEYFVNIGEYFLNAIKEYHKENEETEHIAIETWKNENPIKYDVLVKQIQVEVTREEEEQRRRELQKEQEKELLAKNLELKKQKLTELAKVDPVLRLNLLLSDEILNLGDVPVEWAQFDLTKYETLGSNEITLIIVALSSEITQLKDKETKVIWKELRTKLYYLRQKAMQREYQARQQKPN